MVAQLFDVRPEIQHVAFNHSEDIVMSPSEAPLGQGSAAAVKDMAERAWSATQDTGLVNGRVTPAT